MADDTGRPATRVFTVRLWTDERGDERRGSVRDVATGAYRHFRHWSDLTSFLASFLEDDRSRMEEAP